MIIKRRHKPRPLQKLDALIPRLHPHHPNLEAIKIDAAKRYKGYIGEKKVDYYLERLPIPKTILHDVYLSTANQNFQIDSLIPTQHAIYIIETKNYTGTITFDTNLKQLIRQQNNIEQGFDYPITQAENTKHQLQTWLTTHNIQNTKLHYLIAISEPSTIVRVQGDIQAIAKSVTHAANLNQKIQTQEQASQTNQRNHRQLANKILQSCKPFDYDIIRQHNITQTDIQPGTKCRNCQTLPMKRKYGKWHCPRCQHTTKNAHIFALNDYFLLNKTYISNKEAREFLQINSRSLATRLLKSANLTFNKKTRKWYKPYK